ncbi:MAG: molybdate ABC transporter permease subunit [Chloroflexota bacterium]
MDWQAIWLTARLAFLVTVILLALGTPLAHWLAFSTRRWRGLVEAVVALPLVLPPTVLGFYLLLAMGPAGPVGRLTETLGLGLLPFTFPGLVVASVVYSLPFAVQPLAVAFAAVDRSLIETSWTLGRSPLQTFLRVTAPLSAGGFLTAAVLTFAHTIGEFGVVLMVGGNIPGVSQTISIAIYDRVQALDYDRAAGLALPLLVVSFAVLAITYTIRGRGGGGPGRTDRDSGRLARPARPWPDGS